MSSSENEDPKGALRRRLRSALREIDAEAARLAGEAVARTLLEWSELAAVQQVAAFASLPDEIDTAPLLGGLGRAGKRILLPRVRGGTLEFARFDPGEALATGRYGVREPDPGTPASALDPASLVLVPGLGFDPTGGRLGRGRGYYDRALASLRARGGPTRIVGVGFALQVLEHVPMTERDVRVDGLLTETGLVWLDGVGAPDGATESTHG